MIKIWLGETSQSDICGQLCQAGDHLLVSYIVPFISELRINVINTPVESDSVELLKGLQISNIPGYPKWHIFSQAHEEAYGQRTHAAHVWLFDHSW